MFALWLHMCCSASLWLLLLLLLWINTFPKESLCIFFFSSHCLLIFRVSLPPTDQWTPQKRKLSIFALSFYLVSLWCHKGPHPCISKHQRSSELKLSFARGCKPLSWWFFRKDPKLLLQPLACRMRNLQYGTFDVGSFVVRFNLFQLKPSRAVFCRAY